MTLALTVLGALLLAALFGLVAVVLLDDADDLGEVTEAWRASRHWWRR